MGVAHPLLLFAAHNMMVAGGFTPATQGLHQWGPYGISAKAAGRVGGGGHGGGFAAGWRIGRDVYGGGLGDAGADV